MAKFFGQIGMGEEVEHPAGRTLRVNRPVGIPDFLDSDFAAPAADPLRVVDIPAGGDVVHGADQVVDLRRQRARRRMQASKNQVR